MSRPVRQEAQLVVVERENVEQHAPLAQPRRHRGVALAQGPRERARVGGVERDGVARQLDEWQRPAPHPADGRHHLAALRPHHPACQGEKVRIVINDEN